MDDLLAELDLISDPQDAASDQALHDPAPDQPRPSAVTPSRPVTQPPPAHADPMEIDTVPGSEEDAARNGGDEAADSDGGSEDASADEDGDAAAGPGPKKAGQYWANVIYQSSRIVFFEGMRFAIPPGLAVKAAEVSVDERGRFVMIHPDTAERISSGWVAGARGGPGAKERWLRRREKAGQKGPTEKETRLTTSRQVGIGGGVLLSVPAGMVGGTARHNPRLGRVAFIGSDGVVVKVVPILRRDPRGFDFSGMRRLRCGSWRVGRSRTPTPGVDASTSITTWPPRRRAPVRVSRWLTAASASPKAAKDRATARSVGCPEGSWSASSPPKPAG